jgi:Dickkopf N-terminal cysteine-rich region
MRRLGLILLTACTTNLPPPGGFGVNITVDAGSVDRAAIFSFALHVGGAETYDKTFDVHKPVQSGAVRFQYIPLVRSGDLTFAITALDDKGEPKGYGSSAPVTLVDGKAVSTTVVLAAGGPPDMAVPPDLAAAGTPCTSSTECNGLTCVDGVCCNTACDGVCESCNQAGHKGECLPIAANTDPELECAARVGSADGGAAPPDAGDDGGLNFPDGGVTINPNGCAGTCNGSRACDYPGTTQGCGSLFCNTATQTAAYQCNGAGGCAVNLADCSKYVCESGVCKSTCSSHSDCQPGYYCNANLNQCVTTKDNGLPCLADPECTSGFCVPNATNTVRYCCNSACNDTGMACDTAGSVGSCTCSGKSCANGCQLFYRDGDGDHRGDETGTIANGRAVAGCIGDVTETSGSDTFYPNKDDCDDGDARAFRGQPAYFGEAPDTPRANGTWDFDCSGSEEHWLPEYPGSGGCRLCGLIGPPNPPNYDCVYKTSISCGNGNESAYGGYYNNRFYGFACGFYCFDGVNYYCCVNGQTDGFAAIVPCHTQATYFECGTCTQGSTNDPNISFLRYQRCH